MKQKGGQTFQGLTFRELFFLGKMKEYLVREQFKQSNEPTKIFTSTPQVELSPSLLKQFS